MADARYDLSCASGWLKPYGNCDSKTYGPHLDFALVQMYERVPLSFPLQMYGENLICAQICDISQNWNILHKVPPTPSEMKPNTLVFYGSLAKG